MPSFHRYHVVPVIPAALEPLQRLARNLWWTWSRPTRRLFSRIEPVLYASLAENPLALLATVPQARLEELARDQGFLAELALQTRALDEYLARETWFARTHGEAMAKARIAYFSMEFGIHECLPVYSGGLGVLAGDHLKSASDLGLPLVGIGIAFSQGYFRQRLDDEGWQNERYPHNDWHDLPVSPVENARGERVIVTVSLPAASAAGATPTKQSVALQAWRVDVGRVTLYLLDANLERNTSENRALTNTLYGGDKVHRIRQEILLGVGGVRLLQELGTPPTICHMNEGHSAFLSLERVRQLMVELGVSFAIAQEAAGAGNVFTTHTPVPAGNDGFAHDLIAPYLAILAEGLGTTGDELMKIGRVDPAQKGGEFSMPVLAIRMADRYNGVSMLHGREARAMWNVLWPSTPVHEVPIGSITNGVHVPTWTSDAFAALYERYLGPAWADECTDAAVARKVADIPDEELWRVHEDARAHLVLAVRARMKQWAERHQRPGEAAAAATLLDPKALTIGFARRFATYKRGALLLRDAPRLERILSRADRPVQLVFSGKAHPQDWGGKELILEIVRASRSAAFKGKILFVEDYDMGVARELVSGVDVWLNTPRRPLEASGTSGMKACLNGALHASILDGWWAEAYAPDSGFAIGRGEEYQDTDYGDRVEAESLYRLLEDELTPAFYERDAGGLPRGWIARMKRSMERTLPVFNTDRMVREYADGLYAPAAKRIWALTGEGLAQARAITAWKARVREAWPLVAVESLSEKSTPRVAVGGSIPITAEVKLGALAPGDVSVELYYGRIDGRLTVPDGTALAMACTAELGGQKYRFEGTLPAGTPGEHAFAVRVIPRHDALPGKFATALSTWSD